ncbi:unnamed protein product [Rhizoctonia solani]|uniref:DUF6535 domain-containing protein n=1 Tax=Rhizoctonia solani TaxID=456999 RepID=A0A8H3B4K5_9AGAM|nr:unnamed protein product [Rhizoctonia solani]
MPLYMLTGRPRTRIKKYGPEWNKRSKPDKGAAPQPFYFVDPPQEFDNRGKELSPDAQIDRCYPNICKNRPYGSSLAYALLTKTQAALFSAISTAFVIESYKNLKQDPADVSAQTLLIIAQNIAAMANGSQPTSVSPSSEQAEAPPFTAPLSAIFVNTLWFLSLSLSEPSH